MLGVMTCVEMNLLKKQKPTDSNVLLSNVRNLCVCVYALQTKKTKQPPPRPQAWPEKFCNLDVLNEQTQSCLRRVVQNTPARFGISAETKPMLEVFRQLLFRTKQTSRLRFKEKDREISPTQFFTET